MRVKSVIGLFGVLAVFAAGPLSADSPSAAAQCGGVLQDVFKERNLSIADAASLSSIHDNYCSASGQFNQTSAGVGLEAVIKMIPVKLTGNYSNTTEGFQNFCKNYDSFAASSSHTSVYTERVIGRALDTFDTCVRLAGLGAYVTHKFASPRLASVSIVTGTRPVVFSGLQIDGQVSCEAQLPGETVQTTLTKDSSFSVLGQLSISCRRTARQGKDTGPDAALYDEAVIQIHTNLGETYDALWPRTERLPESDAYRIADELLELRKQLAATNAELSKAKAAAVTTVLIGDQKEVGLTGQLWDASHVPSAPVPPAASQSYCPKEYPYMTGVRFHGNGLYTIYCRAVSLSP